MVGPPEPALTRENTFREKAPLRSDRPPNNNNTKTRLSAQHCCQHRQQIHRCRIQVQLSVLDYSMYQTAAGRAATANEKAPPVELLIRPRGMVPSSVNCLSRLH